MIIYLNNVDISIHVQGNSLSLQSAKAPIGQVLINPIPTMVGIDTDGFWNPQNPASVFFGYNDYSVFEVTAYDEGIEVFSGRIKNISRQSNDTVNVQMQTELQIALNKNLIYSGLSMNPARLFMDMCQKYNIKYDPVSTLRSSNIYELDEIVVSSDVLVPNTPILSWLQQLAQTGVASIYSIGDYLYYKVYESGSIENPVCTLENTSDSDEYWLLSKPILSSREKEIPEGYLITYYDPDFSKEDQTAPFGIEDNAFSISGGQNDLIRIDTLQSAVWIGEKWLSFLSRTDAPVQLGIDTKLARDLKIGYPIRLVMNDGTIPMNIEIESLTTNNAIETILGGLAYGN